MKSGFGSHFMLFLDNWINPSVKLASAIIGIYSIIRLHGFYLSISETTFFNNGLILSAGLFCIAVIIRFISSPLKSKFFKVNYFESTFFVFIIVYALGFYYGFKYFFGIKLEEEQIVVFFNFFFIVIQILIILSFFHSFIRMNSKFLSKRINPYLLLVFSFMLLVMLGTLLFMLPKTTIDGTGLPLIKAIFMAASAVCVTGLSILNVSTDLTFFGQVILLILIQLGGIGIMTLTTLLSIFFSGGASLRERANLKELLGDEQLSTLYGTLIKITTFTLGIELVGFLFVYGELPDFPTQFEKIFFAAFHVISAFCNAGFVIPGNNLVDPIFSGNFTIIITVMVLVSFGGIGFSVLSEIYSKIVSAKNRRRPFSVHSKLVVTMSSILVLAGALTFFVFETPFSFKDMTLGEKIVHSLFLSISPRTAGFNAIQMRELSQATIIFTMVLMFVGGSPNSTAGGIKTTALAVSLLNFYRILTGQNKIRIFKSSLPERQVNKAYAMFTVASIYIFSITLFIQLIEIDSNISTFDILFETVSALNTVGLSLGITRQLSDPSLMVLAVAMFIGRIGFLSIPAALIIIRNKPRFEYIEKSIII